MRRAQEAGVRNSNRRALPMRLALKPHPHCHIYYPVSLSRLLLFLPPLPHPRLVINNRGLRNPLIRYFVCLGSHIWNLKRRLCFSRHEKHQHAPVRHQRVPARRRDATPYARDVDRHASVAHGLKKEGRGKGLVDEEHAIGWRVGIGIGHGSGPSWVKSENLAGVDRDRVSVWEDVGYIWRQSKRR